MQVGELISKAQLEEIEEKCFFKADKQSGPKREEENIANDDDDEVQELQKNDGGTLGKNLQKGKAGVADGGPCEPTKFLVQEAAEDSERGRKSRLRLKAYKDAKGGDFPFTVAAHHLIPGNASLYNEEVGLINYLEDGGEVESNKGKKRTIEGHIGYDVNGSHNGVWLPGNYAIKTALKKRKIKGKTYKARAGTTPVSGVSWEELETDHEPWQYAYVAGACRAAEGQFHDSHEKPYSESVSENLNKIATAFATHLDTECRFCKKKKIPPPFRIKERLFAASKKLRGYVQGVPQAWKRPWFTSEKWSKEFFSGGKITPKFIRAYN
ncbi:MAG: hypothetical protein ACRD2L_05235, partial [Terriglobia bacterium]